MPKPLLFFQAEEFEDPDVTRYVDEYPPEEFGNIRNQPGQWASCIRITNPLTGETVQKEDLNENEAAFSLVLDLQ